MWACDRLLIDAPYYESDLEQVKRWRMDSQNEVMDTMGRMWRMLDSLAENDPAVRTIAIPGT